MTQWIFWKRNGKPVAQFVYLPRFCYLSASLLLFKVRIVFPSQCFHKDKEIYKHSKTLFPIGHKESKVLVFIWQMKEHNGSIISEKGIAWTVINKTSTVVPSVAVHSHHLINLLTQGMMFMIWQNKTRGTSLIPYVQKALWFSNNSRVFLFVCFHFELRKPLVLVRKKYLSSPCYKWAAET